MPCSLCPPEHPPSPARRPEVLTVQAKTDCGHIDRLVELLARGLERMVTGKDNGREGAEDEQEAELDFDGQQSVTTQDRTESPEEHR